MIGSEVPKWLEDAVRKCKEGDDFACSVVLKYVDYVVEKCLNVEKSIVNGSILTIVLTCISVGIQIFSTITLAILMTVPALLYTCIVGVIYYRRVRYLKRYLNY